MPAQKRSVKTKFLYYFLFFCFSTVFYQSCKKADTLVNTIDNTNEAIVKEKTVENFFTLPANAAPVLLRIANELERQNQRTGFIKAFIAKEGFPVWDKARIEKLKRKSNTQSLDGGGDGSDTIVYIPLVVNAQQYVHGFLKATVGDTIDIRIYRQNDYVEFPFQTTVSSSATVTTAEKFCCANDGNG